MPELGNILKNHRGEFHNIVDFDPTRDKLYRLDLSENNDRLRETDTAETKIFSAYIDECLSGTGVKFGIGGYGEHRSFYSRMALFAGEEPRSVHLGTDIWGPAGTRVYAPLGGIVHSFAYNNLPGDYGATIILQHQLDTVVFFTLYGHLCIDDLAPLKERNYIIRGDVIGHFGTPGENGNWPPHLHFQIISELRLHKGDYPGVCLESEREKYLAICPDPDLVLNLAKFSS